MTRILLASAFVIGSLVACGSSSDSPSGTPSTDPSSCTVARRGHFTQRSEAPQLSSLRQPGLHSAS